MDVNHFFHPINRTPLLPKISFSIPHLVCFSRRNWRIFPVVCNLLLGCRSSRSYSLHRCRPCTVSKRETSLVSAHSRRLLFWTDIPLRTPAIKYKKIAICSYSRKDNYKLTLLKVSFNKSTRNLLEVRKEGRNSLR